MAEADDELKSTRTQSALIPTTIENENENRGA